MHEYRKVDLNYLESAPNQIKLQQDLAASPEDLFRFFERSDTWDWAGIDNVQWTSEPPYDANTTRTIVQPSGDHIDEQFLRWEQDQRMTFRLERGDVRMLGAMIEDYKVEGKADDKCQFTWTIGFEFRGLLKLLNGILAPAVKKQFQKLFSQLPISLEKSQSAGDQSD